MAKGYWVCKGSVQSCLKIKRSLGAASTVALIGITLTGMALISIPGWASLCAAAAQASAQDNKPADSKSDQSTPQKDDASNQSKGAQAYSGMYTFLKEGEFVQVTVEDDGRVSGFVSRFADAESDKGAFLDQFFKSAKLAGNQMSFTTEIVRGISYDFKGTVERGEGKNPGEEAYFILRGKLVEHISDANKKVTSQSHDVALRMFPEEAQSDKQ
jgi:hypothetical protein